MSPRRGGGFQIPGSSGSSSSSSALLPNLSELYPYPPSTVHGLLGTAITSALLLIILLILIPGKSRLLPLPLIAANILLSVRYGILLNNSAAPVPFRFEYPATTTLLRLGLVGLFLGIFLQQTQKRKTFLTAPKRGFVKPLGLVVIALYAVVAAVYMVMDWIIAAQSVKAYGEGEEWRLADFDYGGMLTADDVRASTTLMNGGTLGAEYSFERYWVEGLRITQVEVGVAVAWLGVGVALFLLISAGEVLHTSRRFVGPRVSSPSTHAVKPS